MLASWALVLSAGVGQVLVECALSHADGPFKDVWPHDAQEMAPVQRAAPPISASGGTKLKDIAALEFQEAIATWDMQNLLGAMELFLRSAQKGNEVGEYCFRQGQYAELPPSDYAQAVRWYTRGMRSNHKDCTTMLGKLRLAMGQKEKADELLKRTAVPNGIGGETGDSLAQWFLAEMSFHSGKVRDAVRWWKMSAENGDVDAMMRLFKVYSDGEAGIPQEDLRSKHWMLSAASHGHQEALTQVPWAKELSNMSKVEQGWMARMQDKGWF